MDIMEVFDEEPKRCRKCDIGLAVFGILLGSVFLLIGIDVLVKTLREGEPE